MRAKSNPYRAAARAASERVVFNAPSDLLTQFDKIAAGEGFGSRAEAIRAAIKDYVSRGGAVSEAAHSIFVANEEAE